MMAKNETTNTAEFAALDLGSNSFHLITARVIDEHLQPLLRFKQKVQLAAGLNAKGKLDEAAIERGVQALELCAQRLAGFSPKRVHVVATHTLREAKNREQFLLRAEQVLPFPISIISGHEEARLIYRGVSETSAIQGPRLVIDIGGGSTELAAGEGIDAELLSSRSMGCVSYTERFFKGGKVTAKRFAKAMTAARSELEGIAASFRKFGASHVLGTSGSIRTLAQWLHQRDQTMPDVLTLEQLRQCRDELLVATNVTEFLSLQIESERVHILPAGLAILLAIMEELEIPVLHAHDAALREGVLYELAEKVIRHRDVRERTVEGMAKRYRVDLEQAQRVAETTRQLFQHAGPAWQLVEDWQQKLEWAALLHEVGLQINASGLQRHSGYILANADMPGFNKEEQAVLAALVSCYRKKIRFDQLPTLYHYQPQELHYAISLLRLAVLFNTDRQWSQLLAKVTMRGRTLLLSLTKQGSNNPMLVADLAKEVRQQAKLGVQLHVV